MTVFSVSQNPVMRTNTCAKWPIVSRASRRLIGASSLPPSASKASDSSTWRAKYTTNASAIRPPMKNGIRQPHTL